MGTSATKHQAWIDHIAAWAASGQTQRAYCAAQELSYHTFDDGRRFVLRQDAPSTPPPHLTLPAAFIPVAAPNGSPIIGYQELVVKPNTGIPALPKIILDVMMPPTATSMAVPPGFLLADSTYEWEVLAIEAGGNQTLSVGAFRTP